MATQQTTKELLKANQKNAFSGHFVGETNLLEIPRSHISGAPKSHEFYLIDPVDPSSGTASWTWSNELKLKYQLDDRAHKLQHIDLVLERALVTPSTSSIAASEIRFQDFEGYSCIQSIELKYDNQVVFTLFGDKMMADYDTLIVPNNPREASIIAKYQGGLLTKEQRILRAAQDTRNVIRIPHPFRKLNKSLPMGALTKKPILEIILKPLNQCLQSGSSYAGTATSTINSAQLRCKYWHLDDQDAKAEINTAYNVGLTVKGTDLNWYRKELITATEYSSTKLKKLLVPSFKHDSWRLIFWLRPVSCDNSAITTNDNWKRLKLPRYLWLEDSGKIITEKMDFGSETNVKYPVLGGELQGLVHNNYMQLIFCAPENLHAQEDHALGSLRLDAFNNLSVVMQWDADPDDASSSTNAKYQYGSSGCYLEAYSDFHQLFRIKNGELYRVTY
jgi:hypothetical protein